MNTPLVSICLPTLNAAAFLDQRVESILGQTLKEWELIVSDNYSDDGTWELFQRLKSDPRIRLSQAPRQGMYANWNECLSRARGDYVYIATADDTASPFLLERMMNALRRHPDVDLAVCDFDFIDETDQPIEPPRGTARTFYDEWMDLPHRRSRWLEFLVHFCIDISWTTITAVLFRRSLLGKVGLFDTNLGAFGDRFWALRSACFTDTIYVPGRLATWRWHSSQGSSVCPHWMRKRLYNASAAFLEESSELLPDSWRTTEAWQQALLQGPRAHYLAGFALNRQSMRNSPTRFAAGCLNALVHEPSYLARRIASGLSWNDLASLDHEALVMQLIRSWDVPWPPSSISL